MSDQRVKAKLKTRWTFSAENNFRGATGHGFNPAVYGGFYPPMQQVRRLVKQQESQMPKQKEEGRWVRNASLARYLNISKMCLWRWQRDAELGFPAPSVINNISYTNLDHVDQWMRSRVVHLAKEVAA